MLKVELLDATHDRSGFDCGVEPLNRYLQQIARQHIAKGISKTFVLVGEHAAAPKPVLGFFTISLCQVLGQQVPAKWAKKLPEQIPAMRLGRLAVAQTQQGAGYGKALLVEALHRLARVAALAFFFAIVSSAKVRAQTAVPLGGGSYASQVPAAEYETDSYYGLPAVQVEPLTAQPALFSTLHLDPALAGLPIPTNKWWTDLLAANRSYLPGGATLHVMQQDAFGGNQWFFPGMIAPRSYGLDVYFPNAWKPANANGSPQGGFEKGPALQVRGDRGFSVPAADVLIADFEGAGYPAGWTVTTFAGFTSAFPGAPTQAGWTGQAPLPSGYLGNGFIDTFLTANGAGGDNRKGVLTSTAFTIQKHYIHLLAGGGSDVSNTVVRLKVAGNVVATAVGQQDGTLRWTSWDVSAYQGQSGTIEIVDTTTAGWGFIMCDEIVQSDAASPSGRYGRDMISTGSVVTKWGDWNVDFKLPDADGNAVAVTMARGVPFTWTTWSGGVKPRLVTGSTTFYDVNNQPITPSGGSFTAGAFSFAYQGRTFGVFLPDATVCTVSGSGAGAEVEPQLSGVNNYMVIGYLTASSDLAGYAAFAFARPTDTQIAWTHDPVQGVVNTTWTLTTTPLKGANLDTIQGWLPHHWRTTQHALSFLPQQYLTPRGVMKCATGRTFQIAFPFKGIAPVLPAPSAGAAANPYQPARMTNYMAQFNPGSMIGDTYWAAKALAFCAEYMSRAQQMGDTADYVRLRSALKTAMVNWLTYTPGEAQGFFTTYPNWHAFIGFDASYGSQAFNDLHFHYGYFAVAGALLGMQDSQFLADYGPMLRTIVKCYGNWDRADTSEPFLRTFDVWEGHSNAGGLSGGNGNNQESSSEAMQSWGGMFLLGNAMHDGGMAAAGAMGYAMESCTVNEYWQDIYQTNFPAGYNRAGNGILGADSYAYGTYFSGDPAWVYAIQYSPSNHWNNYLKRAQPATVAAKYQAMWNERLAWCQSQPLWSSANSYAQGAWVQWNNKIYHANSAVTAGGVAPDQAGAPWGVEADCTRGEPDVLGDSPGHVVMCYEALWDHDNSAAQFDNYFSANAAIASANGQAGSTYYLIHAQRTLGDQDFSYTTSLPTGAVYLNAATGARTYVVFNPQDTTQSVTVYHNGVASGTMTVPAHVTIATQNANYTATAPPVPTSAAAVASSGQVALTWTGSTLATSYTVRRGSSISGPFSVIGTVDAPGFTDTAVTGGATYFYTFSAANSVGESAQSTAVAATVPSAPALAINCGGSASGAFAADSGFSGGGTSNTASAIDTTGVTDPAPQAVYQTNRFGSHTYTLAGLTAGASYNVRLHFAEAYWNATGQRVFHININGTRVLSSFDIFAAAGAKNKAVIREFTASANASGQLVVQFVTATDNAQCNGIEIRVPRPVTPTNVTANGGPAQVALGWSASASAASYLVKRAPSAGGPFATIASIASTSFTDTGLANGTPLYYVVSSVNTGGESADSGVVSATPTAGITFGTYQQQYFTAAQVADPLVSGPAADANGDGLKNLLAYAFDISPWAAATANMPTAQNSGGYLAITFIRRKAPADITYAIEVSSDLATWNSGAAFTTDVSVTPRDANTDTVVVRDNTASSGAAKRFIRVKVTY